jgi:hypothetical protein
VEGRGRHGRAARALGQGNRVWRGGAGAWTGTITRRRVRRGRGEAVREGGQGGKGSDSSFRAGSVLFRASFSLGARWDPSSFYFCG